MILATSRRTKWAVVFILAVVIIGLAVFSPTVSRSVGAVPLLQKPTQIPMKQSNTQITLAVDNPAVKAGDTFDLNVMFSSDTPSRAAQCALTFNPNLVEVTGVSEGDFYQKWAQANGATTLLVPDPAPDNAQGRVPTVGVSLVGQPGSGPTGSGKLLVYHVKVKSDASGTAEFTLSDAHVADVGDDATGRVQDLAGVTVQGAAIAIGDNTAEVVQPTPVPSTQPQARADVKPTVQAQAPANTNSNQKPEPTVARVKPQSQTNPASVNSARASTGSSFPWVIVIPAVGVVVVGAVFFMTTRQRK